MRRKLDEISENEVISFAEEDVKFLYENRKKHSSFYRNYPSKKFIKKLNKRYRFRGHDRELFFNYKKLDLDQIRRRQVETEINKSKYIIGEEYDGVSSKEDIYFDKAPLPNSYFVDEVVLMPKNPTTLYVYWEIREETFEKLLNNNNIIDNVVIKLFKEGHEYKKIVRHERIGSHYISNVDTSKNYEAFIGYEDIYGNFKEVAHSTFAIVPSDKLSNNVDLLWGTVKEDKNTAQIIKYINSPIPTPENIEFMELSEFNYINNEEFTKEILERLLKIGASEQLLQREEIDRLIPFGSSSLN